MKTPRKQINVIEIDVRDANYQTGIGRYIDIVSRNMPNYVHTYRIIIYRMDNNEIHITQTDTELSVYVPKNVPHMVLTNVIIQMWGAKIAKMQNLILKVNCVGAESLAYAIRAQFYCKIIGVLHFSPQWILDGKPNRKYNPYFNMDHVISVFAGGVNYLREINCTRPHTVILNAIEPPKTTPRPRDDVFRFIFPNGWSPRKGVVKILPAFKKVAEKHNIEVLILGGTEPGIDPDALSRDLPVRVLGLIKDEAQVAKYYDMSDCALFAASSEACSIAGIEAMSRNMPIISSNCEGLSEMFGNAALYVKLGADYSIDVDEYAAHMCRIIENKRLRNKLSVLAYSRYVSRYTAKKMVSETLKIYEKLID